MKRKYIFVAGLPRSGSTLLVNLLAQNPRVRSDAITSGLVGILSGIQDNWEKIEPLRAWPNLGAKARVLASTFHSFYADTDHPIVVDKSRGWLDQIELLEMILGERPKLLVCVRDMRAIMASWEKMWRKNKALFSPDFPPDAQPTVASRIEHWGSSRAHTGRSYLAIQDALNRGYRHCMHFIDFDKLTRTPDSQMNRIYEFIGETPFKHNFNSIEQKNIEADPVPWMRDLHKIRRQLQPVESDWEQILGPPANGLAVSNSLWEGFI